MEATIHTDKNANIKGLRFVPLNMYTVQFTVFADACFAKNKDMSSMLGYLFCLVDDSSNANVVHYVCHKWRPVAWSVRAAALFVLCAAIDVWRTLKVIIHMIIGRMADMNFYIERNRIYDCNVGTICTSKKCFMIDLAVLRQTYERREIAYITYIASLENSGDSLTKPPNDTTPAFSMLIESSIMPLTPQKWVEL